MVQSILCSIRISCCSCAGVAFDCFQKFRIVFFSAQRKIIRSNFTLDMTNDTITLAAIWEEKLRPPNYKKKADL